MTQKEIAKTLNLSVATVSLALRDSPKIKEETREKIKNLARLTKYRPNLTARNLLQGKTLTVGVILPPFSQPFYGELVGKIHHYLKKEGYMGTFFPTETPEEYREAVETLLSRRVDGIISKSVSVEEIVKLMEEDVPVVFYQEQEIPVDYVGVDVYSAGYLAATHLINLGHKKIGFIGMVERNERRFVGYRDALYRHNLPVRKEWLIDGPGYRKTGYQGVKKILSLRERPTAIFAHNDIVAIGAMRAISEAGLKVPDDVAIVGFDNVEESGYLNVTLTTIDQPRQKIAQKLVERLLSKIQSDNEIPLQRIVIKPKLIIRESCGTYLKKKKPASLVQPKGER